MVATMMLSGTYSLGQKCFECKAGGDCRNGGSDILAKPGFWRGAPFFETCIDNNTLMVLNSSGSLYDTAAHPSLHQSLTCESVVSSPSSTISKYNGRANIWPCPGGKAACPQLNARACSKGHGGVACALCLSDYAQDASRRCIKCSQPSGTYLAVFVALSMIALLAIVYLYSAHPIRASYPSNGAMTRLLHRFYKLSLVAKTTAWLHCVLANVAARYLALTTNDDPYADKAFAKPSSIVDSAKILISERS